MQSLARTLAGLAGQDPVDGGVEVVVVSDGSTDGTDEYLASAAVPLPVTALRQANGGPAAARNRGIEEARGTLVLFVDDDVVPAPDLIAAHVAAHDHPDDDLVVVGPMNTPENVELSPWVQWEQDMLYKQYEAMQRERLRADGPPVLHGQRLAGPPSSRRGRRLRRLVPSCRGCRAGVSVGGARAAVRLRPRCRRAALRRAELRRLAAGGLRVRAQ